MVVILAVPRDHLESEVARRLSAHVTGEPGVSVEHPTGDGDRELVMRDKRGHPVGVMGFTRTQVVDFAVAKHARRLGIASALYRHLCRIGIRDIRGPFTDDGAAFVKARA